MLAYPVARVWAGLLLVTAACSFDASGLVSVGPPTSTSSSTGGGETTSATDATTAPPTTGGPAGSDSDSDSTTTPVNPTAVTTTDDTTTSSTSATTSTGPDTETSTSTTEPATTTTTTTTTSTTEPDTTTSTSSTTEPDTTTGVMMECNDPGPEPNDTPDAATDRGDKTCKNSPSSFNGVLSGSGDVDWNYFHGDDGNGCTGNTTVNVDLADANAALQLCVYVDCDGDHSAEFSCPGETSFNDDDGFPGCCGAGSINFSLNCKYTSDDDARIYIRLSGAMEDACVNYTIDYSYDD